MSKMIDINGTMISINGINAIGNAHEKLDMEHGEDGWESLVRYTFKISMIGSEIEILFHTFSDVIEARNKLLQAIEDNEKENLESPWGDIYKSIKENTLCNTCDTVEKRVSMIYGPRSCKFCSDCGNKL